MTAPTGHLALRVADLTCRALGHRESIEGLVWRADRAWTTWTCPRCGHITDTIERPDSAVVDGVRLLGVHQACEGPCVIHRPSEHRLRARPLVWRRDRGIFERICEHGIGHPDPDQFAHWQRTGQTSKAVHGCCGTCCGARRTA